VRLTAEAMPCATQQPALVLGSSKPKTAKTGSSGLVANHRRLDRMLEALLEPVGREARQRAADAIRGARRK